MNMQFRVTPNPFGVPGGVSVTNNNLEDALVKKKRLGSMLTSFHDLFNGVAQGVTQGKSGVMRFDFCHVAVVANVVTNSIVFQIFVILRKA